MKVLVNKHASLANGVDHIKDRETTCFRTIDPKYKPLNTGYTFCDQIESGAHHIEDRYLKISQNRVKSDSKNSDLNKPVSDKLKHTRVRRIYFKNFYVDHSLTKGEITLYTI